MPRKEKEISIVKGKNVSLIGLNKFDKSEQEAIKQVMATYIKKIEERTDYDELKVSIKPQQRNKFFIHEISAELFIDPGTVFSAKFTHKNPYKGIAKVMAKLVTRITHQKKRSVREKPMRKLNRKI